jgi:hypothetical protein
MEYPDLCRYERRQMQGSLHYTLRTLVKVTIPMGPLKHG